MRVLWALLGCAALHSGLCQAQGTPITTVYPVCSYPLTVAEKKLVDATAFMVPEGLVTHDPLTDTYDIAASSLTTWGTDEFGAPVPLCSNSQFYGTTAATNGRTAVMIGRDQFITAPHQSPFSITNFVLVFKPRVGFTCSNFDWTNIPASNVYFPTTVDYDAYATSSRRDYIAFRVDRHVTSRTPVKIRRSGSPSPGDPLFMSGHALHSVNRVEGEAVLSGFSEPPAANPGEYLYSYANPVAGNSGSAIYNLRDEVIDVVVAELLQSRLGEALVDPVTGLPCRDWYTFPEHNKRTNAPLVDIQASIPRTEVLVTPIDEVLHIGDIGGTLSNAASNYSLTSSLVSNQYAIDAPTGVGIGTPGAPSLTSSIAPGDHLLGLIGSTTLTLTASSSGVTTCGSWNYTLNVRDRVNLQNNYLRHRYEIGLQEVLVTPADGWQVLDFGSPLAKTKTYTVQNLRPSEARLRITANEFLTSPTWILVNGVNTFDVDLAPTGSVGDSIDLTLSVASGAASRPSLVTYPARLMITFLDDDCAVEEEIVRSATLTLGTDHFTAIHGGSWLPTPGGGGLGAPTTLQMEVDDPGFCVSDVDLVVGVHSSTTPMADAASSLQITLRSPEATAAVVWDLHTLPNATYLGSETINISGTDFPTSTLRLDDSVTPPLGTLLGVFNGEEADGTWEVELRRSGTAGTIIPSHTRLELKVVPCV